MPTAYAAHPSGVSIAGRNPWRGEIVESYPGNPSARSMMRPIPTLWWLRPVSTHARVGEHSPVVWKLVNVRPPAASRSNVGVSMFDP